MLTGHGVDPALYERAHDQVLDLFTSTPLADKMRFRARRHGSVSPGLFPAGGDQRHPSRPRRGLGMVPPRLRHRRRNATRPSTPTDYWPRADFEQQFRPLVLAHERCSSRSPRRCSRASAAIRICSTRKLDQTNFGLRLNYYPPITADAGSFGRGPAARPRGRRPVHHPPARRASTASGVEPPQRQVGAPEPAAGRDHHQYRRLHAADVQRPPAVDHSPRRQAARRLAPRQRRGSPSRWPSICGRTKSSKSFPASARPNIRRSRRSPSTLAAPPNSTATITRSTRPRPEPGFFAPPCARSSRRGA